MLKPQKINLKNNYDFKTEIAIETGEKNFLDRSGFVTYKQ